MDRTKRTVLNAAASIIYLAVTSILSLFINRIVLQTLGSDYNGVNATVSQSLVVLSLLEGGFTLASLVALYKPYTTNDYQVVSSILSTTKTAFTRIGKYSLIIGGVISFVYPLTIKTELSYPVLVLVFLLSVIAFWFNLSIISKYRLIFQVAQREYIVVLIQLVITIVVQCITYIVLILRPDIIILRVISLAGTLLAGLLIKFAAQKTFAFVDYSKKPDFSRIKGTKDVFIGNVTSYVYSSSTVLFLSTFVSTVMTSIFAVYNSILSMMLNIVYAVLKAPQSALGQVIAEGDKEKVKEVFQQFEYITILAVFAIFPITYTMIMPFIALYTKNVSDANYINETLAAMMIFVAVAELLHIPSGLCINLHGDFKAIRNIQLTCSIIIILSSIIGAYLWGLYGVIGAKLLSALFLAFAEIIYSRTRLLNLSIFSFLKVLLPSAVSTTITSIVLKNIFYHYISSFGMFLVFGFLTAIIICSVLYTVNHFMFPEKVRQIILRVKSILIHREKAV